MPSSYTSLLGLVLPVQGELQGTWGDTVNNELTALLDTAVAGTTTLNTDADVTLSTTTGVANQARQAIILWTANGTVTRNITAPAQSKAYVVINDSAGTQSIVIRGVGPTTGVTIVKGEKALVAWNGTDFVKVSTADGAGSFTNLTVSGTSTLSGLTASTALALNASKQIVSVTNTGTGNNVLATDPVLTLTNATGLPISTGISGLGTGVASALAVNVGTSGAPVVNGGALGTPSSGTLTNATGLPVSTGISGLGTGVATFLTTPSSANLASAVTDETGTGALVFASGPTFSGTATFANVAPTANTVDSVGYTGMPANSQSAAYTTVAADAGKTILHPITDNNARTFTIDSNANVPYPVGTVVTFINMINTVTIAITSDTMYLAGAGTTGSRTLAAYGVATAVKVSSTSWIISGNGLT